MIDNLYSFGSGGGGLVNDVRVNGVSKVINKIAEITSYKEITQDDYDSLPSSKTSDGVAYFISDSKRLVLNGVEYNQPAYGGYIPPTSGLGIDGDIYIKYVQPPRVMYLDNFQIGYNETGTFDTGVWMFNLPTCTVDIKQYGMVSGEEELLYEYTGSIDFEDYEPPINIYDGQLNLVCILDMEVSLSTYHENFAIDKPSEDTTHRLEVSLYHVDDVPSEIEHIYFKVGDVWITEDLLRTKQMNYYQYQALSTAQKEDGSIYFIHPGFSNPDDRDLEPNKTFSYEQNDLVSLVEHFKYDVLKCGYGKMLNPTDSPFDYDIHYTDFQGNDRTYNELANGYIVFGDSIEIEFATQRFGGSDTSTHYKLPSKWTYDGREFNLSDYSYFFVFGEYGNYTNILIYVTNNYQVHQYPAGTWINIPPINDGFIFDYDGIVSLTPVRINRPYKEGNLWNITNTFYYAIMGTNADYVAVGCHLNPDGAGYVPVIDSEATKHVNYMLDAINMVGNETVGYNIYYMNNLYTDKGVPGTRVIANPAGTTSNSLTKIQIGNALYNIPSGGSGSNDAVTQTDTSDDAEYRILLSNSASDTTETSGVKKSAYLAYNPDDRRLEVAGTVHASDIDLGIGYFSASNDGSVLCDTIRVGLGANVQIDGYDIIHSDSWDGTHSSLIDALAACGGANDAVTQTNTTDNSDYRVLLSYSDTNYTETDGVNKSGYLTYNPDERKLSASIVNANVFTTSNGYFTANATGDVSCDSISVGDNQCGYFDGEDIVLSGYNNTWDGTNTSLKSAIAAASGGGGGTTVIANPSGTATDSLTKLEVGSTIYSVSGGTDVNVSQTETNSTNADYEVILGYTATNSQNKTEGVRKSENFTFHTRKNELSISTPPNSGTYNGSYNVAYSSTDSNSNYYSSSQKANQIYIDKQDNQHTVLKSITMEVDDITLGGTGNTWDGTHTSLKSAIASGGGGGASWTDVTGTLTAGSTSITLSDNAITTTSTLDFYTDTFGVNPTAVSVSTGSVTLTFEAQSSNLGVKVRVS